MANNPKSSGSGKKPPHGRRPDASGLRLGFIVNVHKPKAGGEVKNSSVSQAQPMRTRGGSGSGSGSNGESNGNG